MRARHFLDQAVGAQQSEFDLKKPAGLEVRWQMVNPEKQIFHCFGCGEGGNVFSFVMKHQNLPFPEASIAA